MFEGRRDKNLKQELARNQPSPGWSGGGQGSLDDPLLRKARLWEKICVWKICILEGVS